MPRRLAIAALAILVALTGVSVCARGVEACTALSTATPDCCKHAGLAESSCCCPAKASNSSSLPSSGPSVDTSISLVPAVGPAILPQLAQASGVCNAAAVLSHALAPPDTPVALHIALLL